MAMTYDIFSKIMRHGDVSIDASMAAALPTADLKSRRMMALAILKRGQPEGTLGLILHYHRLPEDIQKTLLSYVSELHRSIRQACSRRGTSGPENSLEIIERAGLTPLAYLIAEQLRHGTDERRAEAATRMLRMARRCDVSRVNEVAETGSPAAAFTAGEAAELQAAVTESVKLYGSHKRPAVLQAILTLCPRAMPEVFRMIDQPLHAAVPPLRKMLAHAGCSTVRRSLFLMLSVPCLAEDALRGVRSSLEAGAFSDVLRSGHLLSLPGVTRSLVKSAGSASVLLPDACAVESLPTGCSHTLVAWIRALPMPATERLDQLRSLTTHPDRRTRLSTLRALLHEARHSDRETTNVAFIRQVDDVVAGFCHDSDPRLARLALLHLVHTHYADLPRVLAKMVNADHESVRELATRHLAPIGFTHLWNGWPRLDDAQRISAGRALMKINPQFHNLLHERLHRPRRSEQLRALHMVSTLGQGVFFEQKILEFIDAKDDRLVSAAARCMGSITPERAKPKLEACLQHPDLRVRANAIEGLARLDAHAYLKLFLGLIDEKTPRLRCNAVRGLFAAEHPEATPQLKRMLSDPYPEHRMSALWLVHHLQLVAVAPLLVDMAATDTDIYVRQRAEVVFESLIEALKPVQTEPAASDTSSMAPAAMHEDAEDELARQMLVEDAA